MTEKEELELLKAREVLLEAALHEAQWTIQFLHNCLTNPRYKYLHPEQTAKKLQAFRRLAPPPPLCRHAGFERGCKCCEIHVKLMKAQKAAKERIERV